MAMTLLTDVIACLPGLKCQLAVLAVVTPCVTAAIEFGGRYMMRILEHHPRRPMIVDRMVAEIRAYGFPASEFDMWWMHCTWYVIGAQHLLCGLAMLPALLGGWEPATARAVACVATLFECAYDVYDSVVMARRHFVLGNLPGGLASLVLIMTHHQTSLGLVVPMNMYGYLDSPLYLRMVVNLVLAGGSFILITTYTQLLDVSTRNGMLQMRILNAVLAGITLYTRFVGYFFLARNLLAEVAGNGHDRLYMVGASALAAMSIFNLWIVIQSVSRLYKFCAASTSDFQPAAEIKLKEL